MSKKPENRFFTKGETTYLQTCTFTPDIQQCIIADTGTILDGYIISYDTASSETNIMIGENSGHGELPNGTQLNSPVLVIKIENDKKLTRPLKIDIPSNNINKDEVVSAFSINENGSFASIVSTPHTVFKDSITRFSIYTSHGGMFAWFIK